MESSQELGEKVRRVRVGRKIRRTDAAGGARMSVSTWKKLERGELDLRFSRIVRVAEALGVPVTVLLE